MEEFNKEELKKLYVPSKSSHKGQNGKLMIIGGSHLFHGASLWTLKVASRIVDMVFYSSIPENNTLTQKLKSEVYDFLAIPREDIEDYISEADVVLLGPGMLRAEGAISKIKDQRSRQRRGSPKAAKPQLKTQSLGEITRIEDEGIQTYYLTEYLLHKYPNKKWVIDAGALQMMEPEWLKMLNGNVIITPHRKEFQTLFYLKSQSANLKTTTQNLKLEEQVQLLAKEYNCVVLLKGEEDVVCGHFDSTQCEIRCNRISGGNAGMTKGGTGDVLSGLVAALSCKNDLFLAAKAGSFINKKAGDELFKRVGYYFNASDLADEIPKVMFMLMNAK